ncbi:MAG: hypothetical protein JW912_02075 [Sedimentisphaerales bacterium]|nr:hypothetical protein [Sedimentisphaerales bacterium]
MKSRSLGTAWFWVIPPNRLMTAATMLSAAFVLLLILSPIMTKTSLQPCENQTISSITQVNQDNPDSKENPASIKMEDFCLRVAFICGDDYEFILSDLHSTNVRYIYV